jgi:hypothetical protein
MDESNVDLLRTVTIFCPSCSRSYVGIETVLLRNGVFYCLACALQKGNF